MKRTIALICAVILIALTFTSCKKNIYVDGNGNTHKLVMKKGEAVQDEYGNFVEKYRDDNGKKVTGPVEYPVVTAAGKDGIQNAFVRLNIPEDWEYNETVKALRIHHKGCPDEAACEMTVECQDSKTVDEKFGQRLAAQDMIVIYSGDENVVTDVKDYTTKLFGKEVKAFKARQYDQATMYYYIFAFNKSVTVEITFLISDKCFDGKFDPEQFIKENLSLKTIPTEDKK